jgi:hypothetical protein
MHISNKRLVYIYIKRYKQPVKEFRELFLGRGTIDVPDITSKFRIVTLL